MIGIMVVVRRQYVLAETFEKEIYMRKDPDPFDERHPYRADPSCQFGFLLKQLFRKDNFMKKVNKFLNFLLVLFLYLIIFFLVGQ